MSTYQRTWSDNALHGNETPGTCSTGI